MSAVAGVSVGQQRQTPAWRRQWQHFRYVTTANPVTLLAFIGLGVMIAVAILGLVVYGRRGNRRRSRVLGGLV